MDAIEDRNLCIFKNHIGCSVNAVYSPVELSSTRKDTVKQSSLRRKDNLHLSLDSINSLYYHTNCYLSYISDDHINRHLKRKSNDDSSSSSASSNKRNMRSASVKFDFKKNCIVCGNCCNIIPDKKHPDRWAKNKGFLCRTVDRGKGLKTFKEVLLETCAKRGDQQSEDVLCRIEGAPSDLHAAEARYHEKCLQSFVSQRNINAMTLLHHEMTLYDMFVRL